MLSTKETNIEVALTTILVSFLMKKFNFETVYYGMLYTVVLYLVNNFNINDYRFEFNAMYIIYLIIIAIIAMMVKTILYFFDYKDKNKYLTVNIYRDIHIKTFINYVKANPKYYEHIVDVNYGNLNAKLQMQLNPPTDAHVRDTLLCLSSEKSQELNKPIHFKDPHLNIEGYYEWKCCDKQQYDDSTKVTRNANVNYIVLKIVKKDTLDTDDLFEKMENFFEKDDSISLYYTKILYNGTDNVNHRVRFYFGEKKPLEILEELYIKSFFHQEKDRLYKTIKTVCLNPEYYTSLGQTPRISLLLHGNGGTGKSSLIYRMAQCFQRHIISLDLRNLSKYEAYKVIQTPNGEDYKKYILLFEEFDISIKELYIREEKENKMTNYDTLIHQVHSDQFENVQVKDNKNNQLKLRDLLEIFQGPIPFDQMIIMATTNKYEEIKEMCPELFRPGRLTPVHFDYINKETLQEISMFYFKRKLDCYIPDVLSIPTSQIIELAFESLNMPDSYDYFTNKFNILIRT